MRLGTVLQSGKRKNSDSAGVLRFGICMQNVLAMQAAKVESSSAESASCRMTVDRERAMLG